MSIEEFWIRHMTGDLFGQNFKPVPNDKNNWAPRLGLSWDPTGSGHTVVRAGWGYYYDQINTTTMRGVVAGYPGFITSQIANDSRSGARIPNDFFPNLPTQPLPEAAGSAFRVASDTAESPVHAAVHRRRDASARGVVRGIVRLRVYARRELPVDQQRERPARGRTFPLIASGLRLLLYDDSSPMRIHQAQFRIQKRFANRLGFLFGYTLGSAKAIADTGTPMNNYDPMADWGPTTNDVRHRVVANALYELPFGIQLGGILSANSAPPYNITTGVDANRDASNNDRPAGVGFNAGRGDKVLHDGSARLETLPDSHGEHRGLVGDVQRVQHGEPRQLQREPELVAWTNGDRAADRVRAAAYRARSVPGSAGREGVILIARSCARGKMPRA